jgi:hypothetical protein
MNGLELSRKYFETHGKPALEAHAPELLPKLAAGLVGEGSECFGFDDEISQDHDFEPGFCLWLTRVDYEAHGFALERLYAKLPKTFEGFSRQPLSPVGGNRHGVLVIEDFYQKYLGSPTAPTSNLHWLALPSASLATVSGGEVFFDGLGVFSETRNALLQGYPRDVRLKKLAAHAVMLAQTGLYNYARCVKRGELGAAQLCCLEFVKHAISTVYLLNNRYEPFYKWAYRAMRALPLLSSLEAPLTALSTMGNTPEEARAKSESMEEICALFTQQFTALGLSDAEGEDIERHARALQNAIADTTLRNLHIMDGI